MLVCIASLLNQHASHDYLLITLRLPVLNAAAVVAIVDNTDS